MRQVLGRGPVTHPDPSPPTMGALSQPGPVQPPLGLHRDWVGVRERFSLPGSGLCLGRRLREVQIHTDRKLVCCPLSSMEQLRLCLQREQRIIQGRGLPHPPRPRRHLSWEASRKWGVPALPSFLHVAAPHGAEGIVSGCGRPDGPSVSTSLGLSALCQASSAQHRAPELPSKQEVVQGC